MIRRNSHAEHGMPISAVGQKLPRRGQSGMSALPPKADIRHPNCRVRFVPILLQKGVEGLLGQ
jgi:hypothetical protein